MLKLERISVAYGKHEALRAVSLEAHSGATTVVLGANGAGKTTLLKTIAGLVRPRPGGRILFDGRPIEDSADARHRCRRRRSRTRGSAPVRRHDGAR